MVLGDGNTYILSFLLLSSGFLYIIETELDDKLQVQTNQQEKRYIVLNSRVFGFPITVARITRFNTGGLTHRSIGPRASTAPKPKPKYIPQARSQCIVYCLMGLRVNRIDGVQMYESCNG